MNLEGAIKASLKDAGYRITDNPDRARYWLQANVLRVGEFQPGELGNIIAEGPSTLVGTAAGVAAGLAVADAAGGGLGGAAAGVAAGLAAAAIAEGASELFYDERFYGIVTDIEIAERLREGRRTASLSYVRESGIQGDTGGGAVGGRDDLQLYVAERHSVEGPVEGRVYLESEQQLRQGSSGGTRQRVSQVSDLKRYRTRVISSARAVNTSWEEVSQELSDGLALSIAGLF